MVRSIGVFIKISLAGFREEIIVNFLWQLYDLLTLFWLEFLHYQLPRKFPTCLLISLLYLALADDSSLFGATFLIIDAIL